MKDIRTVGELKKFLEGFPEEQKISLADPNFGGSYYEADPHITLGESTIFLLIEFPFEEAVD
jgi:hypothetical protein